MKFCINGKQFIQVYKERYLLPLIQNPLIDRAYKIHCCFIILHSPGKYFLINFIRKQIKSWKHITYDFILPPCSYQMCPTVNLYTISFKSSTQCEDYISSRSYETRFSFKVSCVCIETCLRCLIATNMFSVILNQDVELDALWFSNVFFENSEQIWQVVKDKQPLADSYLQWFQCIWKHFLSWKISYSSHNMICYTRQMIKLLSRKAIFC